jgi:hypothetical protein
MDRAAVTPIASDWNPTRAYTPDDQDISCAELQGLVEAHQASRRLNSAPTQTLLHALALQDQVRRTAVKKLIAEGLSFNSESYPSNSEKQASTFRLFIPIVQEMTALCVKLGCEIRRQGCALQKHGRSGR